MLAAILICGATTMLNSCSSIDDNPVPVTPESQNGENKKITDGNYDHSLAVKCINGTFVGKKTENVIAYKGIPFVGQQPIGNLRWKVPVDVVADNGVYEAYYNAKASCQSEEVISYQGEDCLYLNVWKAEDTSAEKKPVMVYIHGGAWTIGGTGVDLFDCTNFIKENPDEDRCQDACGSSRSRAHFAHIP